MKTIQTSISPAHKRSYLPPTTELVFVGLQPLLVQSLPTDRTKNNEEDEVEDEDGFLSKPHVPFGGTWGE